MKAERSQIFLNNQKSEIFSNNQSLIISTHKTPTQSNLKVTPIKQKDLDNSTISSNNKINYEIVQNLEIKNEEVTKLKKINEEQQFNIKAIEVTNSLYFL